MKTPVKYLVLLLAISLFPACNSGSDEEIIDEPRELKLSVQPDEFGRILTEDVDFEFEILDGNGGYTATVSEIDGDPDAKVTIEGNKVKVNILVGNGYGPRVTIADKKNKQVELYIESTNESLHIPGGYGLSFNIGQVALLDDIKFGTGAPYTVERVRGNASEAVIDNGNVKVTSLALGDTYYKVRDSRGSVLNLTAQTTLQYDMSSTSNFLEIDAKNNYSATITLTWGDEWQIVGLAESITERTHVGLPITVSGTYDDHYVLFIHTTDKGTGTDTITLRDKDGNLAVVKVHVR